MKALLFLPLLLSSCTLMGPGGMGETVSLQSHLAARGDVGMALDLSFGIMVSEGEGWAAIQAATPVGPLPLAQAVAAPDGAFEVISQIRVWDDETGYDETFPIMLDPDTKEVISQVVLPAELKPKADMHFPGGAVNLATYGVVFSGDVIQP